MNKKPQKEGSMNETLKLTRKEADQAIQEIQQKKNKPRLTSGMEFMTEELAQARVNDLRLYNRPALRKGKRVYEVLGWGYNDHEY